MTSSTTMPQLTGFETLIGLESATDATMLDFWRWGFSNLLFNDVRGVFGEWMVAKLLGIELSQRDSWAAYDLETRGVHIEVKTTAFLQAWKLSPTENPVFSGLKGQTWSLDSGYSGIATYNADLYVFCLQIEKDIDSWKALDLEQWRFFLLTVDAVKARGCDSISLSALTKCTPELTAGEFQREAEKNITTLQKEKQQ